MENEDIQKLVAVVEARSASAEKQMASFVRAAERRLAEFERAAKKSSERVEKSISKAFNGASGAVKRFVGFIVSSAGLTVSLNRIIESAKRLDDLGDTAARLGTSAGELVKWRSALELAGGEMESFAGSAEDFQAKIGAVIGNIGKTKATKQALAALGLTSSDMKAAADLPSRLMLIADAIGRVEDRATRAAIADKLGLRPMLPLLEQGRSGVEALTKQFDELGRQTDGAVGRTGDLAAKIKLLQQELQIKSDNLFVRLGPIISSIYDQISNLIDLLDNPLLKLMLGYADPAANAQLGVKLGYGANSGTDALGGMFVADPAAESAAVKDARKKLDAATDALFDARARLANFEKQARANPDGQGGSLAASLVIAAKKAVSDAKNAQDIALAALKAAEATATKNAEAAVVKPDKVQPIDLSDLEGEEEAVKKTTEAYRELSKTRDDLMRGIGGVGSGIGGSTAHSADQAAALRDEFRNAFRYAFSQLSEGDFGGAAATFAGAFADKLQDRVSDQLFDFVWDSLGLGDVAGKLFGPLDAAQAAQAVSTVQATTAINLMATSAWIAAKALAAVGGGGGGGGLFGSIGSFVAGLFGGTGPIKGVGSGIGGGIGKRALGGPVIAGQPYIVGEKRPELFVPNTSGHIIPRIPQAVSRGASLTFAPVINAPGADPAAITRIEAMMQRSQADFKVWAANEKGRVRGHISDLRSRRAI